MPRLRVHAGCYAVLLGVVTAVIPLDASFGADDGAYGAQVYALTQGSWALDRPLPVVDQANEGWFNTAITPDGPTPYTANPAYALVLRGAVELVHDTSSPRSAGSFALGLQLVPVLGALASACVAWGLAARWRASAAPLAFWLVALGPVLVNATTLWAHSVTTALGGASILTVVELARRTGGARNQLPGLGLRLGFAASLAAATALRTEAALWVVAACAGAVLVDRSRAMVATAAGGGGVAMATWLASRSWGLSLRAERLPVETSIDTLRDSSGWLESRLPAAWQLLMTSLGRGPAQILTLVALTLAGWAALRLRSNPGPVGIAASKPLLVAAAGLYAARIAIAPGEVITGTVAAWPLVAVLLLARSSPTRPLNPTAALLAPAGILVVLVVLTQYAGSGGLQWGGRYLSLAFVPLGVAAAIRGESLVRACPPLVALLVVPAVAGVTASHELHSRHREVVETITAEPSEVAITDIPALPRIAWTALPTTFYLADQATIEALLVDLAAAGVTTVNIQGIDGASLDGLAGYQLSPAVDGISHLSQPG